MNGVFADPTAAMIFIGVLFFLALGLLLANRTKPEPPKPDSIWHEFKQK